jgi:hypothetical protein
MVTERRPQRVIVMPAYAVGLACLTVLALLGLTLWAGLAIAEGNAKELLDRYEADKVASQEQTRQLSCRLFGSQLDAFDEARTPAGKASHAAWLDLYRVAHCTPTR